MVISNWSSLFSIPHNDLSRYLLERQDDHLQLLREEYWLQATRHASITAIVAPPRNITDSPSQTSSWMITSNCIWFIMARQKSASIKRVDSFSLPRIFILYQAMVSMSNLGSPYDKLFASLKHKFNIIPIGPFVSRYSLTPHVAKRCTRKKPAFY